MGGLNGRWEGIKGRWGSGYDEKRDGDYESEVGRTENWIT